MSDESMIGERLIAEFTDHYMEKLFYFCLRKTGNSEEAEDLTQEITLHIITALNQGTVPEHFPAWVWQIARNRYAVWAKEKHKRAELVTGFDIGDLELEDESEDLWRRQVHREQLSRLRRELAFIKKDYREIVVAYYIENKSVRDIAFSLSLSTSAVQQRLHRARIILKEGMNMAREFGVKSYKPEDVTYTNNCTRPGKKNQPYSIMEHKLYQNILLEAYGNPSTAEDLSLELGIALPYMEDELSYLTRETFLIQKGSKYETAIPIVSREALDQIHMAQLAAAPRITQRLTALVDRLHRAFEGKKIAYFGTYQDFESAKWTLLMLAYDHFSHNTLRGEFTERPDGGRWDMIGYHRADSHEPNFVGNHGSNYGFRQFKYEFDGIAQRTPPYLTDAEVEVLRDMALGASAEGREAEMAALARYGYLRVDHGVYRPDVLVLDLPAIRQGVSSFDIQTRGELTALSELAKAQLKDLYDTIDETVRSDLPASFGDKTFLIALAVSNCYHARGYVMAEALRGGWLSAADRVSPAIGAHFYLK